MIRLRVRTFILLFLLIPAMGALASVQADTIFMWDPFSIQKELLLSFPGNGQNKMSFVGEPFVKLKQSDAEEITQEELSGTDRSWYDVRIGHFHLFVSRYNTVNMDRNAARFGGGRDSTLETLKSLPVTLRSEPSRAMESMGRIFEPQLNLGIEF